MHPKHESHREFFYGSVKKKKRGFLMYVDTTTVIEFAALLGAFSAVGAFLYKAFRWMERQKAQDAEIDAIKKEQCVMCYGLLATLDGLKQLGANGNVTDAHEKLEKHLNQSAHDWDGR